MVSHSIDFELYSGLVYKCIDCSEPSGVGFDPSRLCRLHVQCVVYIVYILVPWTLCRVPCALSAGPMYQLLPCPCVLIPLHDLSAYCVCYFALIAAF